MFFREFHPDKGYKFEFQNARAALIFVGILQLRNDKGDYTEHNY